MPESKSKFEGLGWPLAEAMIGDLAPLIRQLRSDRELDRPARDWLADYLEGKIKRPRGRPPKADLNLRRMQYARGVKIVAEGLRWSVRRAVQQVAFMYGVKESTIRDAYYNLNRARARKDGLAKQQRGKVA